MDSKSKKSILFIIFSLQAGGTQRMMVNVLNEISIKEKRKILYIYNYSPNPGFENQLDEDVKIYTCGNRSILKNFLRILVLIRIINKEKILKIVSFAKMGTYIAIIAKLFYLYRKIPILYRMVSVDSALITSKSSLIKKVEQFLYLNILCRSVDKIISQSNFMAESLIKKKPNLLKHKVETIHNILLSDIIIEKAKEAIDLDFDYIIYVGRFSKEKNIKGIIDAFLELSTKINEKLVLIGNGYLRSELENYIKEMSLSDRIILLGYQKNPYKYISKAKCLILFSYYEGLPNVVLESMMCETTVIVSDFEGVNDIVKNGITGFIVERGNIKQLSNIVLSVIKDVQKRITIERNAFLFVKQISDSSVSNYKLLINKL